MKDISLEEKKFLIESNAIEGVHDEVSLKQAIVAWKFLKTKATLTQGVILKTHKILMLHQPIYPDEKGYFRTIMVYIGNKPTLNAMHIPKAITSWLYDQLTNDWKKWHVEYEKIHPFIDGNGRTGRMFMNWHRLKLGLPLLIIHAGKEQMEYYKWFS